MIGIKGEKFGYVGDQEYAKKIGYNVEKYHFDRDFC